MFCKNKSNAPSYLQVDETAMFARNRALFQLTTWTNQGEAVWHKYIQA